jgi:hypothetical protein
MLIPIILGFDKMTVKAGNSQYLPLYLSIGSIHNNIRRAHRGGVALVAFIPFPKSMCYRSIEISSQLMRRCEQRGRCHISATTSSFIADHNS